MAPPLPVQPSEQAPVDGLMSTRVMLWAAVGISVPLAAYAMMRPRPPSHDPRFDAFLKQRGALPTGEVAPAPPPSASARGTARTQGGSFEHFLLRTNTPLDTATSNARACGGPFEHFLKSSCKVAVPEGTSLPPPPPPPAAVPAGPSSDDVRVAVVYGTEYGFAKEVAQKLFGRLQKAGSYWPVLVDMADHPHGYDLAAEQAVLMICSTQGDGVPPSEAREFCETVFAGKAGSLATTNFSVCALGDKTYTHFCRCGEMLDSALGASGGQRLVERASVNREDWPVVDCWVEAVLTALPKAGLKTVGETGGVTSSAVVPAAGKARWGKSRPYSARVVAVEGLCNITGPDDKNTIRVEFDLGDSGVTYLPGDALGLYASNPPQGVDEVLAVLGASGAEVVPTPSWHYQEPQAEGLPSSTITLRHALLHCYDLRTPKVDLLQLLCDNAPAPGKPQQLLEVAAAVNGEAADGVLLTVDPTPATENGHAAEVAAEAASESATLSPAQLLRSLLADEAAREAYLEARHVVDVLETFPVPQLDCLQVLSALRPLQPRLYSISSSPLEHPQRVQVSVAEVRYSSLGRQRLGVCSTFLSDRIKVGDMVPLYVAKNPDFRLPSDISRPVIMIGPGTGLAPFRAFITHRVLQAAVPGALPCGPMVLFFGCRRRDQDYLYGDVLEGWAAAGVLDLHTAFSREQAGKVYVQQRVREAGAALWQHLEAGGHVYVCGDAASMAGAVEVALLQVFEAHLVGDAEVTPAAAASKYLEQLTAQGRYERDIWY